MSKAAVSMVVFGIYLCGLGILLMCVPNFLLSLFGIPGTSEVYIRVVGAFCVGTSYYYFAAARVENQWFFRRSVEARPLTIVAFILFALLGFAPPILILLGVVDLFAAIWTHRALRAS